MTCLTVTSLITNSCQRWPNTFLFILQGSALVDLSYGGRFYDTLCRSEFLSATVKELLKSDSICQSYVQVKKCPVFLTHSVES